MLKKRSAFSMVVIIMAAVLAAIGNAYAFDIEIQVFTGGSSSSRLYPFAKDFDGDHIPDMVLFDASTGMWYIKGTTCGDVSGEFGYAGMMPYVEDFNGDGQAEVGSAGVPAHRY